MRYHDLHASPSLELAPLRERAYQPKHDFGGPYELFYRGGEGIRVLSVHASREAALAAIPAFFEHHTWALSSELGMRPENTYCSFFGPDEDLERRRKKLASSTTRSSARALKRSRDERSRLL